MTLTTNGCSGDDFVQTGNSLIFTAASTQYLSITGNTGASALKFTSAFWVLRNSTGAQMTLYNPNDGTGANQFQIAFLSGNTIQIVDSHSSSNILNKITTATFTDTSSFHSIVVAADMTQATAALRVRLYYDGTEITSWSTNTIPAQNTSLDNNVSGTYDFGRRVNSPTGTYFNGNLALVYYIDGQQLTPASFISGTPGVPINFTGSYTGVFDCFLKFSNGTSTTTLGLDSSGEGNNWTLNNMTTANQSTNYP